MVSDRFDQTKQLSKEAVHGQERGKGLGFVLETSVVQTSTRRLVVIDSGDGDCGGRPKKDKQAERARRQQKGPAAAQMRVAKRIMGNNAN